ncbi:MAG: type II toxin-antitoxin system RelE/ParE family toxin [Algicola sp.]|nr:type II toxin-antitoxin system RelE/ParE family toxin [Algicola sp.]
MWTVLTTTLFNNWFDCQADDLQEKVLAGLVALQTGGPGVGRPLVDTVNASKFKNMKELRVQHRGEPVRAFFAFDPERQAIVLCAGNKGGNEKRFYKQMIPIADREFKDHLNNLEADDGNKSE